MTIFERSYILIASIALIMQLISVLIQFQQYTQQPQVESLLLPNVQLEAKPY